MIRNAFEGALAKLNRAEEHFATFEIEREMFFKRDPYRIEVELDLDTGWHIATFRIVEEPPALLSVLLGELAYETLSALNHLTWELAARKKGRHRIMDVKNQVQFPVCRTPDQFAKVQLVKKQLVGREALRVIERLQPYDGRMGLRCGNAHPLMLVKEIADADKHRVLMGSFAQVQFSEVRWDWDTRATGEADYEQPETALPQSLKDGVELTRIRFKQGNRKANPRASRTPEADLRFHTDLVSIRYGQIRSILPWLKDVALFGLSSLFNQDRYLEPTIGWRAWWELAADTRRGLEKPACPRG